ncbi:hypothetical protein [Streptomyces huiliensis]|uniref:hypothetical protein n=1 Tax=Streptomyces huiliensis TaxID=2876027 RepID=UPI001CBFBA50|nr:hypothetical protein [Streptomyces huiliensis]MBZ4319252.1 hypothetical protein [Streptomyces huiliensis]
MSDRGRAVAAAEGLGWWAGLMLLWVVLIGTVDVLEAVVGAGAAAGGAWAARAARRAAAER